MNRLSDPESETNSVTLSSLFGLRVVLIFIVEVRVSEQLLASDSFRWVHLEAILQGKTTMMHKTEKQMEWKKKTTKQWKFSVS